MQNSIPETSMSGVSIVLVKPVNYQQLSVPLFVFFFLQTVAFMKQGY